uniref:Uncharacterized protein n=1 Tax=Plectus sambesii TaxID=2011161 RepID=A0A914X5Z2_9BILA
MAPPTNKHLLLNNTFRIHKHRQDLNRAGVLDRPTDLTEHQPTRRSQWRRDRWNAIWRWFHDTEAEQEMDRSSTKTGHLAAILSTGGCKSSGLTANRAAIPYIHAAARNGDNLLACCLRDVVVRPTTSPSPSPSAPQRPPHQPPRPTLNQPIHQVPPICILILLIGLSSTFTTCRKTRRETSDDRTTH